MFLELYFYLILCCYISFNSSLQVNKTNQYFLNSSYNKKGSTKPSRRKKNLFINDLFLGERIKTKKRPFKYYQKCKHKKNVEWGNDYMCDEEKKKKKKSGKNKKNDIYDLDEDEEGIKSKCYYDDYHVENENDIEYDTNEDEYDEEEEEEEDEYDEEAEEDEYDEENDDEYDEENDDQNDEEYDKESDEEDVDEHLKERLMKKKLFYSKLFNIDENENEFNVLSPKYNMNIYNILEKNYDQNEENQIVLTIKNLNYEINNRKLITNLNLQLNKTECIGLIGNNGCGKTTLLNLIYENSDNKSKNFILNNKIKKKEDPLSVNKFDLNTLSSSVKKNDFSLLYKILSYMKNNSIELSNLPTLIENKSIHNILQEQNKDKNNNSKNNIYNNNNELFYKNEVFYFKQNIHLLENNHLTIFEKVLKFYDNTLEKYEILNYIEENFGKYEKYDTIKKYGLKDTQRKDQIEKRNHNIIKEDIKNDNSDIFITEQNKNDEKLLQKSSMSSNNQFNNVNTYDASNVLKKKNEEDFLKSEYFKLILKLYMHEKENIYKEINNIKMNFNKYVNILNLKNFLNVKLCHLSNGYIIRVYLLLLLLSESKLLLIDEINNNLDIFNIFFIMNIFKYSLKYKKLAIILATHDFFLVSKLCNRILDFNKISGYDIDLNNMSLLKKINKHNNHNDEDYDIYMDDMTNNKTNDKKSNLTYFKGNYTDYLNNMKILFENRKKKKEELKKILDQINSVISKSKKKKKNDFIQPFVKKKEEELKLYQNINSILFDTKLDYQYLYYNLIYSNKKNADTKAKGKEKEKVMETNSTFTNEHKKNVDNEKGDEINEKVDYESNVCDTNEGVEKEENKEKQKRQHKEEQKQEEQQKYQQHVQHEQHEQEVDNNFDDDEDIKKFVYNKFKYVEGNMNKNILIDMSKKIKNNELIETGEKYGTNNMPLYEFENFSFYFLNKNNKKKYIFKNMNLNINSGENVLLLGKNGIGKSTLFKILTNKYNFVLKEKENKLKEKKSIYVYGDNDDMMDTNLSNIINDENIENRKKNYNFEGTINCNFKNVLLTYFEQNMIKKLNAEINDYFKNLIEKVNYEPINFYNNYNNNNDDDILSNENFCFYILNKTKLFYNEKIDNIEEKINKLLKIFFIDSNTSIKDKSGGEKVRILFLSLFLKKSNLLLLDEINNNLDIYLKNLLLNFLNYIYQGSYILTTHDFYIIKNLNNIHKIIYIFDYQNIFTFYNVQDFIQNFYNFILNSFNLCNAELKDHEYIQKKRDKVRLNNYSNYVNSQNILHSNNVLQNNIHLSSYDTNKNDLINDQLNIDQLNNSANYQKYLYDNYDYEILQFLKKQFEKDNNERKNYEQINIQEEIFQKKKINKKNFGGKGTSGKIKIKNWKRWKK
ncbi:ABC transporter, putative [Plasmodium sp. gorilla clade G2]|uniref:ABC transporter, putative n=1 Tax=Plasmodium sp. gorilla clade G2 TaxID=880535 RepID=UPI000D20EEA3|nr:ABC transporter, putative [Plasmodium sp. gorilla clade G2]SOV13603.1 ABC transporter, putative [Plasmodium sp. gorilla clade G2]